MLPMKTMIFGTKLNTTVLKETLETICIKEMFMCCVLPGVSPYGFGGLTVSPKLMVALVVLSLLDCGVVATVNVLWGTLVVVLVVVATVVLETLVDSVALGTGVLYSSMLSSVPVGPQSINPATVVVRPS